MEKWMAEEGEKGELSRGAQDVARQQSLGALVRARRCNTRAAEPAEGAWGNHGTPVRVVQTCVCPRGKVVIISYQPALLSPWSMPGTVPHAPHDARMKNHFTGI